MTHLANLIKLKANLTDEQAQLAAEAVMDHFKLKFPHILHAELDRVAEGGEFGDTVREKFDDVRDKVEAVAKQAGAKAEELAKEVGEKLNEWFAKRKA
ncbi:hypothetical protein [Candidatus Pollutiaquabacter sp.]|jgi:uncharacterized protein YicC (UPF0701 family)|uniref:hypothetical protein n=1 Tax=Candidatus Pollutiaquabacter sp. TaxID=3416354 RepID=UPI003CC495F0|nr:hypothetical protein [Bacteroidota bacterium]